MNTTQVASGNIIQITDASHPWYPSLLIVDEVHPWGVQAYAILPKSNDGSELPAEAYNRLKFEQIEVVGVAAIAKPFDTETGD